MTSTEPASKNSAPLSRPLSVRIRRAVELTGLSRTTIYHLIKAERLEVIKVGSVTLIPFESLERFLDSQHTAR